MEYYIISLSDNNDNSNNNNNKDQEELTSKLVMIKDTIFSPVSFKAGEVMLS